MTLRERKRMDKNILIRTYKDFLKNPDKVFVCRDFPTGSQIFRYNYLNTLIRMGLIEEVTAFYFTGSNKLRRRTRGYKLKRMEAKE